MSIFNNYKLFVTVEQEIIHQICFCANLLTIRSLIPPAQTTNEIYDPSVY